MTEFCFGLHTTRWNKRADGLVEPVKNPALVTDPIYEFLGFETELQPPASVRTETGFVADVEKKDAIVAAFKVSVVSVRVQHACSSPRLL